MRPQTFVTRRLAAVLACTIWSAVACLAPPPTPEVAAPAQPDFVGRLWAATSADAAPGSIRAFLADGTLLMDSCGERYRLSRWRSTGASSIAWEEDTATVEAEVVETTAERLRLRLTLRGGETRDETYRPAAVPFVC